MNPKSQLAPDTREFAEKIFKDVACMTEDPAGGISRAGYSDRENSVHAYLKEISRALHLEIEVDRAGNLLMTLPGRNRALPCFMTGSHADSVPQGGNFDGLAGVAAALCTVRSLITQGCVPERDTTVVVFRSEESSWFGKAYIGSLSMVGALKESVLDLKHRTTGISLRKTIEDTGFSPVAMTSTTPSIDLKRIGAFTELHIEQGPVLDADSDVRVGVVTGIRGNVRHKQCICLGERAHSGAVDRRYRHDAVFAFSHVIADIDARWKAWLDDGKDLVVTTGVLNTEQTAAISVVPGKVTFSLDIRSLSERTCSDFLELFKAECALVAADRGVVFKFDQPIVTKPACLDDNLCRDLLECARVSGVRARAMASGAGHDAAVLANAGVPAGMIFVANRHGSHNPNEAMAMDDFMAGTQVLYTAVCNFNRRA